MCIRESTRSVMDAIDPAYDAEDDFELVDELNKVSKTEIPKAIEEIRTAPVLHDTCLLYTSNKIKTAGRDCRLLPGC